MTYFLDTSALVKIYHREAGSERMLQMYRDEAAIQLSDLARVEFVAAATRKLHSRKIDADAHGTMLSRFHADLYERYEVFPFSELVLDEAIRIIARNSEEASVRTLDALQFAFYNSCCEGSTVFVCCDHHLLKVVQAENHPVLDPSVA